MIPLINYILSNNTKKRRITRSLNQYFYIITKALFINKKTEKGKRHEKNSNDFNGINNNDFFWKSCIRRTRR